MDTGKRRLRIKNLSARYGEVVALEDLSLEAEFGRCLAVMGPNGAGKSTLIKVVAGLVPLESGILQWQGGGGQGSWRKKRGDVAYLAQHSEVDWSFPLTVRALVELGRYPHTGWWRRFGREDARMVEEALVSMHLGDLAERQIGALSGGQRQRAFLARALAQEAEVLLLDEPYGGLDLPSQEMLGTLLGSLAGSGKLVMLSHHDIETVAGFCDDVLLLNRSVLAFGLAGETLTPVNLEKCFGENKGAGHPLPAAGQARIGKS